MGEYQGYRKGEKGDSAAVLKSGTTLDGFAKSLFSPQNTQRSQRKTQD
jgi:hypothetical protein